MSSALEQVLLGIGTGVVVLALSLIVKRIPRPAAVFLALGAAIIGYVLWPHAILVEVPDLSDLSRDDASVRLTSQNLTPDAQPQFAPNVRPEHVIPSSQNPLPGTRVQPRSIVHFSVSIASSAVGEPRPGIGTELTAPVIFSPTDGGDIVTPTRSGQYL